MHMTNTIPDIRRKTHSETVDAVEAELNVTVEMGNVVIKTHALPRVDVQAELRGVNLDVWQEDGCVYVRAENDAEWFDAAHRSRRAEITITTPADCPVFAHVVTGALVVEEVNAAARTHVITGQTRLRSLRGAVHATTVTGDIEFDGALSGGTHHFAATTGSVRLALDEVPDARVYAWATMGRVYCELPLSVSRRGGYLTGDHLYGVAGSGEGRVIAEVVTGQVQLSRRQGGQVY